MLMDVSNSAGNITNALADLTEVTTSSVNMITGNTILFVMFVASLVLIGFKIFKRAKRAAKA